MADARLHPGAKYPRSRITAAFSDCAWHVIERPLRLDRCQISCRVHSHEAMHGSRAVQISPRRCRCSAGCAARRDAAARMVPLSKPPKADLAGKPALIVSGQFDPITPPCNSGRLSDIGTDDRSQAQGSRACSYILCGQRRALNPLAREHFSRQQPEHATLARQPVEDGHRNRWDIQANY